mgnify:FL=1
MTSQQEDFHIDVGCYSPPTATDATIIGTNGAQPTGEYAGLDPLWVQPSGNHYNGTSFDAPLGLDTIPTQTIHYQPQLEQLGDFDAIVPLPEHLLETLPNEITPLDPAPFLLNSQEDLVPSSSNLVPIPSTNPTEGLSKTAPDMQKLNKPSTKKESCARTYHRQPQQKQNRTFLHPNPIKVRSKKSLKVCPAKKKAPPLLTKDTQTWVSKSAQSTQTLIDSESSFHNDDYSKIHTIMKKLDTSNPLHVTPPSQTFQVIQHRQGLLQAMNIIVANVNKKEATTTYAMFHRSPFPPYKQP